MFVCGDDDRPVNISSVVGVGGSIVVEGGGRVPIEVAWVSELLDATKIT